MFYNYNIIHYAPNQRYKRYERACKKNKPKDYTKLLKAEMIIAAIDSMRRRKLLITEDEIDNYYMAKAYIEKYMNKDDIIVKERK